VGPATTTSSISLRADAAGSTASSPAPQAVEAEAGSPEASPAATATESGVAGSAAPAAEAGAGWAWSLAHVTYLTSQTVYIDAGSDDGIAAGQRLEVVRSGTVVAVLIAEYVSSKRTSCAIQSGEPGIVVGDTVRFAPAAPVAPEPLAPAADPSSFPGPSPTVSRTREMGLRGRVGVRYLYVQDGMEGGATTSQPALDLRLDGRDVGGSNFDLEVDVRARRTHLSGADLESSSEGRTSVYRLATAWQADGSPWRFSAGRQFSPSLASVSIYDGVQGEYRSSRFSVGAFSGTQPDPSNLGYSSSVREHGGYVEFRNAPEAHRRWSLTSGLIGSYEEGTISREFAYLQGSWHGPRFGMWATQEVDYNRGWKTDYEGQSVSPTSTFLSLRYKAFKALTLRAGYDNRRNVRLYRDRVTPETQFDDEFRNGLWGGVETRLGGHFRAGVDVKTSDGGSLGSADSTTVMLGVDRLTRAALYVSTRSTRYSNDSVDGTLNSLSMGLALGSRWHAELSGGVRDETSNLVGLPDTTVTWYGVDIDVAIGRGWFVSTSMEHSGGDLEKLDQAYTSVTWRF
jgi:hypothetical protein